MRPVEFYILLALAEGDLHGYGIIQTTLDRSGGEIRLDPGTLYRAIVRLADAGLLCESDRRDTDEAPDQRRRYYSITPQGRRVARAEAERMAGLVEDARSVELVRDAEGA
jgi:DNA-binding PadR family transcriptional regulator